MEEIHHPVRRAVERAHAETYLLIALTAFASSVVLTRLFLAITGYPQLGNSVLHIAHALWGGLLLLIAILLPLILANRWALSLSALLSGLGVGLFIDEVGKFITQQNDYFYPPAAPLIYAFFLLMVFLYIAVRRVSSTSPRAEMYRALSGLFELLDDNLDPRELQVLLSHLEIAGESEQPHVAGLATTVQTYLQKTDIPLVPEQPSYWKRLSAVIEERGKRFGRSRHRWLIMAALVILALGSLGTIAVLLYVALGPDDSQLRLFGLYSLHTGEQSIGLGFWYYLRMVLEILVSVGALLGIYYFMHRLDMRGVNAALLALLVSLTGIRLFSYYFDQFSATTMAVIQLGVLLVVLAYREWYLREETGEGFSSVF
jgi:hypothetical protein